MILDPIPDGDREAWIPTFTALVDRLRNAAGGERSRPVTMASARWAPAAGEQVLRDRGLARDRDRRPDPVRTLWDAHRDGWDVAVDAFDPPVERLAIAYEGTTIAGYFFPGPARSVPPTPVSHAPR